jgi:hypothetical protein
MPLGYLQGEATLALVTSIFGMTTPFDLGKVFEVLKSLRALGLPDEASVQTLRANPRNSRKLLQEIHATREHLVQMERVLDAILVPEYVFDRT